MLQGAKLTLVIAVVIVGNFAVAKCQNCCYKPKSPKSYWDQSLKHNYAKKRDKINLFTCREHGGTLYGLDFYRERNRHYASRRLFEDPEFPANNDSLFMKFQSGDQYPSAFRLNKTNYRWLRPGEIVSNPKFVVGGQSRFDAKQGQLDDCCLCASISTLTLRPDLLARVVPLDQGFGYGYAGIFHFRFWHYGEWVDVVIDDRLPTLNGSLIFMRSEQKNEFWSALLEKAYAKLWGNYESLCNRCVSDIMEDLTGGVTETIYVDTYRKEELHKLLFNAHQMGALINGVIHKSKTHDGRGLIRGHAYSITDFAQVNYLGANISLIRLRNPWGTKHQWTGPFGDESPEWNYVRDEERRRLLVVAEDGEFWMSFSDFFRELSTVETCMFGQECDSSHHRRTGYRFRRSSSSWYLTTQYGQWSTKDCKAGGYFTGNLACNPQYSIRVSNSWNHETALVIEVMQKHGKEIRGIYFKKVGFAMILRERKLGRIEPNELGRNGSWVIKPTFKRARQVYPEIQEVRHLFVAPGEYLLIVSTESGGEDGDFLLRVLSTQNIDIRELD